MSSDPYWRDPSDPTTRPPLVPQPDQRRERLLNPRVEAVVILLLLVAVAVVAVLVFIF